MQQPQPIGVAVGGVAALSVIADGTVPLSYQWYKGGTAITSGANASLVITNAQLADEANYSVVVTNLQARLPARRRT